MVYVMLYEAIGTCIFSFGINMSAKDGIDGENKKMMNPICVGLLYFAIICFLGVLSGGHFNPAVSLGVLIKEGKSRLKTNIKFFSMIVFAQLIGAIMGVLLVYLCNIEFEIKDAVAPYNKNI